MDRQSKINHYFRYATGLFACLLCILQRTRQSRIFSHSHHHDSDITRRGLIHYIIIILTVSKFKPQASRFQQPCTPLPRITFQPKPTTSHTSQPHHCLIYKPPPRPIPPPKHSSHPQPSSSTPSNPNPETVSPSHSTRQQSTPFHPTHPPVQAAPARALTFTAFTSIGLNPGTTACANKLLPHAGQKKCATRCLSNVYFC